jgi:signal transduction histidine kinase
VALVLWPDEAHGGRVWAENRAGGGAWFVVTLPVADEPATPLGQSA